MIRMSVGNAPAEIRGAVLAMKRADAEVRRDVSARLRSTMNGPWRSAVESRLTGSGPMEARMLTPGARIAAGNPPTLVTASSRRRVGSGGGLTPDVHWRGFEYGAKDSLSTVRSSKGKSFQRHTKRHLPASNPRGRVIGPAVANILPRVAAFWAQSVVRAFMDAAEKR